MQNLWVSPNSVTIKTKIQRVELSSQLFYALWILDEMMKGKGEVTEKGFIANENGLRGFMHDFDFVSNSLEHSSQDAFVTAFVVPGLDDRSNVGVDKLQLILDMNTEVERVVWKDNLQSRPRKVESKLEEQGRFRTSF